MASNYYQILQIPEDAPQEDIKKAYRRLARQFHPDVTQDPSAEEQFKEINRAYDILSNPLKRADYDTQLHPAAEAAAKPPPEPGTEEAYAWQPTPAPAEAAGTNASRISATIFVFLFAAALLEFFLRWLLPDSPVSAPLLFIPGLILGAAAGLMWGVDNNIDMENVLGPTALGRFYNFLRSILYTITLAYFFSLIGAYLDYFLYDKIFFLTPLLGVIGAIIGATLGSSGESPARLANKEGRFELYCIMLRGVEVGAIAALIGALFGLIFIREGYPLGVLIWGIYFGFVLGMIVGSINPPHLTAYASYVSASLKNVIISVLIIAALLFGLIIGSVFSEKINQVFAIIWQSLQNIIGG